MNLYPHRVPEGSAGDDFNVEFCRRLLPDFERMHPDQWLLGSGAIVDRRLFTLVGPKVVLGSGYNPEQRVPRFGPDVDFRAVRGLLSAGALGLEPRDAVCDPGFVVADWLDVQESPSGAIGLVPHVRSEMNTGIAAAAEAAGLEVVSPRLPFLEFLRRISRCARIYCEFPEAAVFADALRVPWARVVVSERHVGVGRNAEFHWRDVFSVLGVDTRAVNNSAVANFGRAGVTRAGGPRSDQLLAENRLAAELYQQSADDRFRLSPSGRLHERLGEFHARIARLAASEPVAAGVHMQPV